MFRRDKIVHRDGSGILMVILDHIWSEADLISRGSIEFRHAHPWDTHRAGVHALAWTHVRRRAMHGCACAHRHAYRQTEGRVRTCGFGSSASVSTYAGI